MTSNSKRTSKPHHVSHEMVPSFPLIVQLWLHGTSIHPAILNIWDTVQSHLWISALTATATAGSGIRHQNRRILWMEGSGNGFQDNGPCAQFQWITGVNVYRTANDCSEVFLGLGWIVGSFCEQLDAHWGLGRGIIILVDSGMISMFLLMTYHILAQEWVYALGMKSTVDFEWYSITTALWWFVASYF